MGEIRFCDSSRVITVQNVYCIGKNYADHIKELESPGTAVDVPREPVIFLKPNTSVVFNSKEVSIPELAGRKISSDLQNEVELVIAIGEDGKDVPESETGKYTAGYAAGIDFTLRDLQSELKKKGLPWALSKGFRGSAPVSEVMPADKINNALNLNISLRINGVLKQNSNTSKMIFSPSYIIHYISCIFGLRKGDLIFTGTPAGVSHLNPGDVVQAEIEKVGKLEIKVV